MKSNVALVQVLGQLACPVDTRTIAVSRVTTRESMDFFYFPKSCQRCPNIYVPIYETKHKHSISFGYPKLLSLVVRRCWNVVKVDIRILDGILSVGKKLQNCHFWNHPYFRRGRIRRTFTFIIKNAFFS